MNAKKRAYSEIFAYEIEEQIQAELAKQKKKGAKKSQQNEAIKEIQKVNKNIEEISSAMKRLTNNRERAAAVVKMLK